MKRDKSVDIAKAIGIILMVLGHAGVPHSTIIFRFHMALFFILSGWCFSDKYLENFKSVLMLLWKKVTGLYIPFVLFNGVVTLLRDFLININVYTNNQAFLEDSKWGGNAYGLTQSLTQNELKAYLINIFKFNGESQLGGAMWFLRVMFGVSIIWCLINWILKTVVKFDENMRMWINIILSLFFMMVSWQWGQENRHFSFLQLETVAAAYIMFCAGYYLKRYYHKLTWMQNIVVMLISVCILCYCDKICSMNGWDSNVNFFANPYMYLVSSFAGFFAVFSFSQILSNLKVMRFLEILGQHTLGVLIFHFLSFKLVTYVQCIIYTIPLYRIASFPVYNATGYWWLIYTIVGIAIPLIIALAYNEIKKGGKKVYEKERHF